MYAAQSQPTAVPRWTINTDAQRLAALEAEEAKLAAEERALKAELAELNVSRRRREEERAFLSNGYAMLMEQQSRYYTEPVPDLLPEIGVEEQECAVLQENLHAAEVHLAPLQQHVDQYEPVLKDRESLQEELKRVSESFELVEQRRKRCGSRAERFFDVEAKRVVEANRAIRRLDAQLKEMTTTGPLAQLRLGSQSQPRQSSRSTSRCVTFAGEKSIVLDLGRDGSQGANADEESGGSSAGMSYSGTASSGASHLPTTASQAAHDLASGSVCLGVDEEEDDMGSIGGASVAFSLNQTGFALGKRRKLEIPTV